MMTIVEDLEDDARLAMASGTTVGEIADPALPEQFRAKVLDPKADERVRTAYVNGIWRKPNDALAAKLATVLGSQNPGTVKLAAALAVGYAGSPTNDDALIRLLDDPNARRYAAIAGVLGGGD